MTTTFIAYTRVSTQRQGEQGVSIHEQHRAIVAYATLHHLTISSWQNECSTAAKCGRPVFRKVMKLLKKGNGGVGLLVHKIDRGARNLADWAAIGEVIDQGVDVRFVHDDLDLTTRGGRLSADIQAVIAADYIRNLREEVRKGITGRLKQGLYPFKAPRGYQDRGSGKVKTPDPFVAPLIVATFKRYASGKFSLQELATEMAILGLTTKSDRPLRPGSMAILLKNPFYKGDMVVVKERFQGIHQPLVSDDLFDRVQRVFQRRRPSRRLKHVFRFRGMLRCTQCDSFLIGERQKQFVYYRCHHCRGVSVREDRVGSGNRQYCITQNFLEYENLTLEPWEKFDSHLDVDTTPVVS